jgi:outer membrane protein assembly factor BamE (lipoprotein component of BamABCDE complex)
MKKIWLFFLAPLMGVLVLAACSSAVTPQSIAQIKPGMKTAEVEALLGRPTHIEESETTGLRGDVYYYPGSHGEGRVIFLNDIVFKAEFVPEGKSA